MYMEKRITVSVCHVTSHPVYLCIYWCNEVVKTVRYTAVTFTTYLMLRFSNTQFSLDSLDNEIPQGGVVHWFGYL